MRPRRLLLSFVYSFIVIYILYYTLHQDKGDIDVFAAGRDCMRARTESLDDETLWNRFHHIVNKCSIKSSLNIKEYANTDELKFHVAPLPQAFDNGEKCTIISLGIGKDVEAEKSMKEDMPNCDFYGADPVNEDNVDIFPEVGKFYNVAVGAKNGSFRSYILQDIYRFQDVKYIDIATFMRTHIKRQVIDQIMVDIEHAEYPMLPFLLHSGELSRDGVIICQMNIEIHRPDEKQIAMFSHFYHQLAKENRWTMLEASTIIGHLRLYMINDKDEPCRQRYFKRQRKSSRADRMEETEEN